MIEKCCFNSSVGYSVWLLTIRSEGQAIGDNAINAEARATLYDGEEPVCERMQDRRRERETEIGTKNNLYSNWQQLQMTTTNNNNNNLY